MSENSTLLTAYKAARLAIVQKMATGQSITEYSDGVVRIRKESPVALLKELDATIVRLEGMVATENGERSAVVLCPGGPC